jgi:hypothetical protein
MTAFLCAPAGSNAKEVKRRFEERIRYVDVDDPMVGVNANTPDEYTHICNLKISSTR